MINWSCLSAPSLPSLDWQEGLKPRPRTGRGGLVPRHWLERAPGPRKAGPSPAAPVPARAMAIQPAMGRWETFSQRDVKKNKKVSNIQSQTCQRHTVPGRGMGHWALSREFVPDKPGLYQCSDDITPVH